MAEVGAREARTGSPEGRPAGKGKLTSPARPAGSRFDPGLFAAEVMRGDREVVVAVRGEIDLVTAPVLWESLVEVLPDTDRLVVDLADTEFIDSTGLGVFVRALKRLRHHGGDLVLRSPRPNARKVLSVTGLDRVMTITD